MREQKAVQQLTGGSGASGGGSPSWWTEARERCLELTLVGKNKAEIAKILRKSRRTIVSWSQHPEFVQRTNDLLVERMRTSRTRRQVATLRQTDRLERAVDDLLEKFEQNPEDRVTREAAFDTLREFREQRDREDSDSGFNVQQHQHVVSVEGGVTHQVAGAVAHVGFREFLQDAWKRGAIDAEVVEALPTPRERLLEMTSQALLDSDILDKKAEHERAAAERALTEGDGEEE